MQKFVRILKTKRSNPTTNSIYNISKWGYHIGLVRRNMAVKACKDSNFLIQTAATTIMKQWGTLFLQKLGANYLL